MDQSAPLDGQSVFHTIGAWPTAPLAINTTERMLPARLFILAVIEPSGKLPNVQGKWKALQNNPPTHQQPQPVRADT